ncbi:CHASE domain-containing protein [Myxococcota bacterium]|nr:CHASE domain-containing protein [Myxococcota bacterium]
MTLAATAFVALQARDVVEARDRARFDQVCEETLARIVGRMGRYEALLMGASGLFAASDEVSAKEFAVYVERLEMAEHFPGTQGVGFTQRLLPDELDEFLATERRTRPDYRVWPEGPRAEYHTIRYLEPGDRRNRAAIGYDMHTEETRRAAMDAARDSACVVASGRVTLVQEIDSEKQPGFLLYHPVYRGTEIPPSVADRREGLRGFVYSPLRAADLFRGIFDSGAPAVGLEVFAGEPSVATLLFATPLPRDPPFVDAQRVVVAGQPWTLRMSALPHDDFPIVLVLLAGGGVLGLVLSLGVRSEVQRSLRAEAEASIEREAKRAVAASEARLRAVIEHLPVAIGAWSDGKLVFVNAAFARMLGCERAEELLGAESTSLVSPEDVELLARTASGAVLRAGERPIELRLSRRDGQPKLVSAFLLPIELEGRSATLCALVDETEQRQLVARMAQLDRMVAVGTLAAGVAHEINNPLSYVLANVAYLEEMLCPPAVETGVWPDAPADVPALQGAIADAHEGAVRVREIVRGLKAMSRVDVETKAIVDLHDIIESSIKIAWNEIRHSARLRRTYGDLPRIHANEARLGQVVLNLLQNAAEAIAPGAALEHEIHVATRRDGGKIILEVSDTGAGIAEENLGRIFEPFFTTKPVGVGTGLGLPIVQGIVVSMGGAITVKSAVGRGTTFTVSLPESLAEPPKMDAAPTVREAGSRLRVLVVDDEEKVGQVLRRAFREHDVTAETNARVALARIERGETFDAIFCDLMMPDVTGVEFHRALAHRPELQRRIVFMSGDTFSPLAQGMFADTPNLRVDKPFDFAAMRKILAQIAREGSALPPT